ncbi:MAG: PilZ domain-containing protein [Desulfobulbaceae bacterium]|nr:PilZ domain-containing protein [Desulfobulbaceae bacterium]
MDNEQFGIERRVNRRFKVNERAIAVLNVGSRLTRIGRIVDISRSGIAFDYLLLDGVDQQAGQDDMVGEVSLNILTEDGLMALVNAQVVPVSERLLQSDERFYDSVPTCRCGLKFENLSLVQDDQLGNFILNRAAPLSS